MGGKMILNLPSNQQQRRYLKKPKEKGKKERDLSG
jgi:hypothetical protein